MNDNIQNDFDTELDIVIAPPELEPGIFKDKGLPSFLQDMVNAACNNSEASEIAVTLNVLAYLSAYIGREKITCDWGDFSLDTRPSLLLVGDTGSGKGISETLVKTVFNKYSEKTGDKPRLIRSGLNSGEGLIHVLRDYDEDSGLGNKDKRVLAIDSEFAKVLTVCNREGSTLSSTLRNLHDGEDLDSTTKNDQFKCTRPHSVMMGHITKPELLSKIKSVDMANGFLNRFMICNMKLEKYQPIPKRTPDDVKNGLVNELEIIMRFVDEEPVMTWTEDFENRYDNLYGLFKNPNATEKKKQLLTRTTKYVLMVSMLFAIMERKKEISINHLNAALHIIRYWWASIGYIFSTGEQEAEFKKHNEIADKIYNLILEKRQCTKNDIVNLFNRKVVSQDIDSALKLLLESTPPKVSQSMGQRKNGGRRPKIYTLRDNKPRLIIAT
jgi:hypothetical protein